MAPLLSPVEEFARRRSRALTTMRQIIRIARESQAELAVTRQDQFSASDLAWVFDTNGPIDQFLIARQEYDQGLFIVYDQVTAQTVCDRLRDQWQDDQDIFDELEELLNLLKNLFA